MRLVQNKAAKRSLWCLMKTLDAILAFRYAPVNLRERLDWRQR
jgi:hypothetical protein